MKRDLELSTDDCAIVFYNLELLLDAGYITGSPLKTLSGPSNWSFYITGITFKGHDYLDAVRDDDVYAETKSKIQDTVGTTTLDILKNVATRVILAKLGF